MMDTVGNKEARTEIAAIKVAVPRMALEIIDRAIQVHGGAGVTDDFGLAWAYAVARAIRIIDGPNEVHRNRSRGSNCANMPHERPTGRHRARR